VALCPRPYAEERTPHEIIDTRGDGICWDGARKLKITVNGEPGGASSEIMFENSTCPDMLLPSLRLDAAYEEPYETELVTTKRLTTGADVSHLPALIRVVIFCCRLSAYSPLRQSTSL
jgi:hypothetical protein